MQIGFIGAGFSADLHAEALAAVRGREVRLAAVTAASPARAESFAKRHGVARVYADYRHLLSDPAIDAVSICVPNALHAPIAIEAANQGKHIICEKPMTGAFGIPGAGAERARAEYRAAMDSVGAIEAAVLASGVVFCYAENWIYAPSMTKTERLLDAADGVILDIRAEESHSGSHAARSRRRETAGGGALLMLGSHPIGAAIHLKRHEHRQRGGDLEVVSVVAETASLYRNQRLAELDHQWIVSDWDDVETWATTIMTFSDETTATIASSFAMLGGVRNSFEVYGSNAAIRAKMTANDSLIAYSPDAAAFGGEYLQEKTETRAGWVSASPDEDWARGYPQEMQDFVEAIADGRDPVSDLRLARDVVDVIYASYLSAAEGRRVTLKEERA